MIVVAEFIPGDLEILPGNGLRKNFYVGLTLIVVFIDVAWNYRAALFICR
jgi:hypothetical protein